MSEDIHISVPDYQHEWLDTENISPSAILQDAVDDRMDDYGFDVEQWKATYGE